MGEEKILITGADGFIGSHLSELLVKEGYRVKALVQYNSFNSWGWLEHTEKHILNEMEVIAGDIRDPFSVKKAMTSCSSVMHLAALIAIPYSYQAPQSYIETNVSGTLNVVQAAKELGLHRVIHTSTSEVYGTAQYVPINEKHPLQPQSPYSASKIAADQIALSYYYAFDLPVTVIRPFNTYGPRQSARAVIPTIITQIMKGDRVIKLGALEPTRDFTFVTDTAKAFALTLNATEIEGKTINLGINFEISIANLVKLIAEVMEVNVEVVQEEARLRPQASEVERLCSDNSLAKQYLNWSPEHQDLIGLKRGLIKTVEWFLQQENRKLYKPEMYVV